MIDSRFLFTLGNVAPCLGFLKRSYTWDLSNQSENVLNHSRSIIMTRDNSSCRELREYGRQIVSQSLSIWSALTKAVEKDKTIADIVVGAKVPSPAWKILTSMVEDDSSERVREQTKKNFEGLSMDNAESRKHYIARAMSLALSVQYNDMEVTEQELSPRVLNGLTPAYAPAKQNFALRTDFSLGSLEGGLVRVEELNRSSDGTDGSHALAADFKARSGRQSGGRAAMAADTASATIKVARQTNVSRNNISISSGTSESSSRISSGSRSSITDKSRNSRTSGISGGSPHSNQGDGVPHAFVSGAFNTRNFCQSAVQYSPHVFLTKRARKLLLIHILETTPILGAGFLHHYSQPPRRRTLLDRPFRPSRSRDFSSNRPPWRNLRH